MFLTLTVIAGVAAAVLFIDRMRNRLPDVEDDEFLQRYTLLFEGRREEVLSERRYLGKTLGLPHRKLAPEQTWDELARHAPLFSFDVGAADVGSDLDRLLKRAATAVSPPFPTTIGATIQELIRARRAADTADRERTRFSARM
jgi:hypothetical protein